MYVEHSLAGTRLGTSGSVTFGFDWTPPAIDVGKITIYVVANAANGNNQDDSGDHIYTATWLPDCGRHDAAAHTAVVERRHLRGGNRSGLVGNDPGQESHRRRTAIRPVRARLPYMDFDRFHQGTPTSLDDVSVSIGGKAAFVYLHQPHEINVQAPDINAGDVAVTVRNANGVSNSVTVTAADFAPGFFRQGNMRSRPTRTARCVARHR